MELALCLSRLFLLTLGAKHPGQLSRGRVDDLGNLAGRRQQQASQLGAELVERGKARQRFHALRVQQRLAHDATQDHEVFVVLCKGGGHLGSRDRIVGVGDAGGACEKIGDPPLAPLARLSHG